MRVMDAPMRAWPRFGLVVILVMVVGACDSDGEVVQVPSSDLSGSGSGVVRETVEIETLTFPGHIWDPFMPARSEATPATVTAVFALPPSSSAVPAVVITHGCGGLGAGANAWGRELVEFGYATLVIDSFRGRDVGEVCSGQEKMNIASVLYDVYRGLDLVAADSRVDESRVALLGFSFGGRTALWANQRRFKGLYGSENDFVAYLSFYPASCYLRLEDEVDVGSAPMRIFHGTEDDWLPIEPCRDYVERMQAAGRDVALFEYDGALHAFDDVSMGLIPYMFLSPLSPRNCAFFEQDGRMIDPDTGDVAGVGSTCVESGVTAGYDAEAAAQVKLDVTTFLETVLRSSSR